MNIFRIADHQAAFAAAVNLASQNRISGPARRFDDLFENSSARSPAAASSDFFDEPRPPTVNSLGSGFVIDRRASSSPNNHVIADANGVYVIFTDGTATEGRGLGKGFEGRRRGAAREARQSRCGGEIRRFRRRGSATG